MNKTVLLKGNMKLPWMRTVLDLLLATVAPALSLVLLCSSFAAADTIDTRTGGTVALTGVLGCCPTVGVGNSFTVGSDNVLNTVTFYLLQETTSNVWVALYANFNGTTGDVNPLFVSPYVSVPGDKVVHEVTFDMGGFVLTPGEAYAALVYGSTTNGQYLYVNSNTYSGGHFVWAWTTADSSNIVSQWNNHPQWEVAFQADLSSVPEPGTLVLLGTGLAGLWLKRRKSL